MDWRKANIAGLAVVFILAFLAYFTDELVPAIQAMPLIVFGFVVLAQVYMVKPHVQGASLFSGDGSLFIWLIPWFTLGCSLNSTFDKSLSYWIIDTLMLVLARLYTVRVPVEDIFESFFWAAVCALGLLCITAYEALIDLMTNPQRLWLLGFHPNTLGYIMSGFVAVMLWKVIRGGKLTRVIGSIGIALSIALLFFASSRGSILSLGLGLFGVAFLYFWREKKIGIPLLAVVIMGAMLLIFTKTSYFNETADYVDDVLKISNGDRGLGSGLTGRTDIWHDVIAQMSHGTWIYGNGMRASDGLPDSIDNGFIVVIYDMGIIPFLLIIGRVAMLLWRFPQRYSKQGDICDLLLSLLMVVYLLTNFVERLLYGVGNPLSLLMFLIVASPWSRVREAFSFTPQKVQPAFDGVN